MIIGIGTDIIEIDRIARSVSQGELFKKRVFSDKEIAYCEKNKNADQHYAARYAAKEAFFKALGTGWRGDLKFNEVEVDNDELGKPFLVLYGEAERLIKEKNAEILISLSHVKQMAIAMVIIQQKSF
jgi:holo-[acyl-carrier protein] synthase